MEGYLVFWEIFSKLVVGAASGGWGREKESGEQLGPITFHCRSWRDVVDRVMHRGCPS